MTIPSCRLSNEVRIRSMGQREKTMENHSVGDSWLSWIKLTVSISHLNLVRSVTLILQVLAKERAAANPKAPARSVRPSTSQTLDNGEDSDDDFETSASNFDFTQKHKVLQLRLQPLFRIRRDLEVSLGSEAIDEPDPFDKASAAPFVDQEAAFNPRRPKEFFVTSQQGWRSALDRVRTSGSATKGTLKGIDDAIEVIAGCGDDIKQLWADDVVQSVLAKHKIQLEHSSGL